MARVKLKEGYTPLRGIYCGMQFRVRKDDGMQLMHYLRRPEDEEVRNNPAARAERVIGDAVSAIQARMQNQEAAMREYRAIRARVQRDYRRCCGMMADDGKLCEAIVEGYFQDKRKRPSKEQRMPELPM